MNKLWKVLAAGSFAAAVCAAPVFAESTAESVTESMTEPMSEAASGGWKTGIGVVTSMEESADAGEEDGKFSGYSTVAAIVVDDQGVIQDCVIDAAQTVLNFSAEGKITSDLNAEYVSKNVLGDAYGMKGASSIGKEWYEQAAYFAQYCVGKTVEEVAATQLEERKAVDADIISGATIKIDGFLAAIAKADEMALSCGPSAKGDLHLSISTDVSASKDAAEDADGQCQAYNTYVAASIAGDGTVEGCYIDASQATLHFDREGRITDDITAGIQTKNELGEAYGMKKASSIGKEWNEQAQGFAAYCVGKKVSDLVSMELNEGIAADTDVLSTATVHIDGWLEALAKMQG